MQSASHRVTSFWGWSSCHCCNTVLCHTSDPVWLTPTFPHAPSYLIPAISLSQSLCLLAVLRAAQDSYVAMVIQSLTSHCWSRESASLVPVFRADTRRRKRSLQLVREIIRKGRKGLESKKTTFGLEKQSFINLGRKNGRRILGRWLEGGRQVDSNDPTEHSICCLKREAWVNAQDEIKDRKQENTAWWGRSIQLHRSFSRKCTQPYG